MKPHRLSKLKPSSQLMKITFSSHTSPKLMPSTQYTSNRMLGFFSIGTSYTQRYFPSGYSVTRLSVPSNPPTMSH